MLGTLSCPPPPSSCRRRRARRVHVLGASSDGAMLLGSRAGPMDPLAVAGEPVLAVASEAGGGAVSVGIGGEVAAGARPEAAVPGERRHDALRLARRE
jgi:hypothetical protein